MASLRQQKEAFVSGHAGTTIGEVSAVAAAPVVLLLLWRLMQHPAASGAGLFHRAGPTAAGLALEFAALVLPQVAHLLGLASPAALLGGAAAIAAALFATQDSTEWEQRGRSARGRRMTDVLRDALSAYRASLMLGTCIAILGVDFHAFPRRFAKAETFGTGLMDAGVGSFVAVSGLAHGLSAAARAAAAPQQQQQQQCFPWGVQGGRAIALLALGLGRVLATGAADYQNHASEYGIHWNFFLTLAALRLLGLLLPWAAGSGATAAAAGGAVLAAHQWGLSAGRLIEVVHSQGRGGGLLSANKEGLLSLPGYWALQLLGTAAGHAAYRVAAAAAAAAEAQQPGRRGAPPGNGASRSGINNGLSVRVKVAQPQQRGPTLRLLAQLAAATGTLWLAYWAAAEAVQPVSRRACNAAYVLWMLALNVQCVALFVAAELGLPGTMPHLMLAVSAAMLPFFLAANLLTGALNLAVNALAATDAAALLLVSGYMALLCGGVVTASKWRQRSS